MLPDFGCRHALLLQGPAGPFFRRFARELTSAGVRVTKINLHPGDALFYPGPAAISYRGTLEDWPEFLRSIIRDRGVDAIFMFGDCRPYHRRATRIAKELSVTVWVFEEGYLRPDYITLERNGVNGNSHLPSDPEFYLRACPVDDISNGVVSVRGSFAPAAGYSIVNAMAFTLLRRPLFPHYRHHRELNAFKHAWYWARGGVRKVWFSVRERTTLDELVKQWSARFYLVPLQVHCDFQLTHSPYADMRDFIREVVETFSVHADPQHALVLKHHPMDRPFREYGRWLHRLARRHRVEGRLFYVHDLHLPTLLKHARGTITVNSTVGLSSLHHGTPVKTMGTAVYDMPGLTFQGSLADFLRDPGVVDTKLYRAFRRYLERTNQANGNFYRRLPGHRFGTGVRWFEGCCEEPA